VSAGGTHGETALPPVQHALTLLAPAFAALVTAALADANVAGLDAVVYESLRSHELAVAYYARGRTVIPPKQTVTNAPDELWSWHGYGLAVDVISRAKAWGQPESWFAAVAVHFANHRCRWGGEWKQKDLPHFQFGKCKPSPSSVARALVVSGGREAVWKAVGATV
jgi:hypothetical protein